MNWVICLWHGHRWFWPLGEAFKHCNRCGAMRERRGLGG